VSPYPFASKRRGAVIAPPATLTQTWKGVWVPAPGTGQDALVAQLVAANVGMARIYCSQISHPSFAAQASFATKLKVAGIEPLPYWEYTNVNPTDSAWAQQMDEWATAISDATYFEVGNEPDRSDQPNIGIPRALALVRIASPILRAHGKQVMLVPAQSGNTIPLLNQAVTNGIFTDQVVDAVAIHCYPAKGTGAGAAAANMLTSARTKVPQTLPIFITEIGDGTSPPEVDTSSALVDTEAGQALHVDRVYNALWPIRNTAGKSQLGAICWFWWKDKVASGATNWAEACGLRKNTDVAKPSLTSFTAQLKRQAL
jgi:hypothetical protein